MEKEEKLMRSNKIMFEPPIKYAVYGGTRLAMILGNADENVWNWFYSNHIQLYFNERILSHGGHDHRVQFISFKDNSYKIFVDEKVITDENYNCDNEIVATCKEWIKQGYFLQPYVDARLFKNTNYIDMKRGAHSIFIYDYIEESGQFAILDYDEKRKFRSIYINEDVLVQGFASDDLHKDLQKKGWANKIYIKLYKFKPNVYEFDLRKVVEQLECYLKGVNNIELEVPIIKGVNNACFGVDIYDALIDYIKDNKNREIDDRAFKALVEHKEVMVKRFEYMKERRIFSSNRIDDLKSIEQKAKNVFMYVLKYNLAPREQILKQICENIEELRLCELNAIRAVLQETSYEKSSIN